MPFSPIVCVDIDVAELYKIYIHDQSSYQTLLKSLGAVVGVVSTSC